MKIEMTIPEAQLLLQLIDKEVRTGGVQASAAFGPVSRQMIDRANEEAAEMQKVEAEAAEKAAAELNQAATNTGSVDEATVREEAAVDEAVQHVKARMQGGASLSG